ncbi:hypothetical protein [Streptomyces luteocolor]|nr:hypothetical protein [Streptomyces luteocolor]
MAVHGGAPVPICHTRAANRASRAVARALGLALPGWIWTVR